MVPAPQASGAVPPSDLLVPSPFILTLCLLATALFSAICKPFALFASFFARAILCFQHLTNSFCKNTGVGVSQHWPGRRVNQVFLGSAALPAATSNPYV